MSLLRWIVVPFSPPKLVGMSGLLNVGKPIIKSRLTSFPLPVEFAFLFSLRTHTQLWGAISSHALTENTHTQLQERECELLAAAQTAKTGLSHLISGLVFLLKCQSLHVRCFDRRLCFLRGSFRRCARFVILECSVSALTAPCWTGDRSVYSVLLSRKKGENLCSSRCCVYIKLLNTFDYCSHLTWIYWWDKA